MAVATIAFLAGLAVPAEGAEAPARPEAGTADWRTVSSGERHTCGIRTTGRLYCWGFEADGQLGIGTPTTENNQEPTPVEVDGGHTDWTRLSAGRRHTCGIRSGRLYCWGWDGGGPLGDDAANVDQSTPVEVDGAHADWTAVSAGSSYTCGRRSTGRLYCWGSEGYGELGDGGANTDEYTPVEVAGGHTDWTGVDVELDHTCGRRSSGRLYCWGRDTDGQLGNGGLNTDRPTPTQVAGGHTDWTSVIAVGALHTCARRSTGRLYCWGRDSSGEVGNGGTNADRPTPVEVAGGYTNWTSVSAGLAHTCGRRSTGRLYCWGNDVFGQVGNGAPAAGRPTPAQVAGGYTDWTVVSASLNHTCARRSTARLYCWGNDDWDQLGNGSDTSSQFAPVQVEA